MKNTIKNLAPNQQLSVSRPSKKATIRSDFIDYNEILDTLIDTCIAAEFAVPNIESEISILFATEREEVLLVLEQLFDVGMVYQSMDTRESQGILIGVLAILVQQRLDIIDAEAMEDEQANEEA